MSQEKVPLEDLIEKHSIRIAIKGREFVAYNGLAIGVGVRVRQAVEACAEESERVARLAKELRAPAARLKLVGEK